MLVDASLVAAPRQRYEKKAIKQGWIPANLKAKPAKLRHTARDARWTVKFSKAKRPVIDEKFGAFIGKIVSRLDDEDLGHQHWVSRRPGK